MKQRAGYLHVQNPNGVPFFGLDEEGARRSGRMWIAPPIMTTYEAETLRCNHCENQFLKNSHRKRDRHWCWNCDKYICDRCANIRKVAGCVTMRSILDREATKVINAS